MGLRPTVKSEVDDGSDGSNNKSYQSPPTSSAENEATNNANSSSSSSSAAPQREAWTARGQLLLNFHDAISRAINSPEMMRKCAQIAEDMSRKYEEEMGDQQPSLPTNNQQAVADMSASSGHPTTEALVIPSATHSVAEEYAAEAALIVENKEKRDAAVRNKSLALGLFSFVALRSGRGLSSWMRRSIANRASRPYQFDSIANKNVHSTASATATATAQINHQPSKLRRFFRLTLDVTISTSITLLSGTFLFMPKPSAYIEDMSKLPLVEGKSVYAEMVCPPLLKEYRRVLEQYGGRWPVMMGGKKKSSQNDDDDSNLTQEDVSLNIIRTFVENCSKRSKYERALVEERNALNLQSSNKQQQSSSSAVSRLMRRLTQRNKLDDDEVVNNNNKLGTVPIPSPGVPESISVDVDHDVYALATDDELNEEAGEGSSSS